MRKKIPDADGQTAIENYFNALKNGKAPQREDTATSVRYLLQLLAERAPGASVEVRVPPFGAVQAIPGPKHTRGTPSNVIEMNAQTWINLACGQEAWDAASEDHQLKTSGNRADLGELLPLIRIQADY